MAPEKTLADLQREHGAPPVTRHHARAAEDGEQSPIRNYVRDLVLGYNDGVVSVYAIMAGVAGAALGNESLVTPSGLLLTGVAASIAGALSMGAGEYISTKSQAEYYRAERARESEHLDRWPQLEIQELRESLEEKGLEGEALEQAVGSIAKDKERFLEYMMRDEFGVGRESERSPWAAAGLVMVAFLLGAIFPVAAYAFLEGAPALIGSTILSLWGLFMAGYGRALASRLPGFKAGMEMVLIGIVAAGATFGVGWFLGVAI